VRHQFGIATGTGTAQARITLLCGMTSVARRGDLQYLADRLDPVDITALINEIVQDLSRRSSSAWAKTRWPASESHWRAATPCFTLQCLDAVTLFTGDTFPRAAINLMPAHPFVQRLRHAANLGRDRFDRAHSDGYSPRCSCTIRTARSRTSGEKRFDLLMAPFSQRLEPPQNPGRFTPSNAALVNSN